MGLYQGDARGASCQWVKSAWTYVLWMSICLKTGCAGDTERHISTQSEPASEPTHAELAPLNEDVDPHPFAWPHRAEEFGDELRRFESIEGCVEQLRSQTPTAVSEGLLDFGYDAFFTDVCTGLSAAAMREPSRCDTLTVSNARAGCRRRAAWALGDPSMCPEDRVLSGPEPLCVAWAARNVGLCRAVSSADRNLCVSVLDRDASRCERRDRARCEAWLRRYGEVLGTERNETAGTRDEPRLHVSMVRVDPDRPRETVGTPNEMTPSQLARGVVLRAERCAYRVSLDEHGENMLFSRGHTGVKIEFEVGAHTNLPSEIAFQPAGATIEINHPEMGRLSSGRGKLTLLTFEPRLGGAFSGELEAEFPMASHVIHVTGQFRTFIRYLEPLPADCGDGRMELP